MLIQERLIYVDLLLILHRLVFLILTQDYKADINTRIKIGYNLIRLSINNYGQYTT